MRTMIALSMFLMACNDKEQDTANADLQVEGAENCEDGVTEERDGADFVCENGEWVEQVEEQEEQEEQEESE